MNTIRPVFGAVLVMSLVPMSITNAQTTPRGAQISVMMWNVENLNRGKYDSPYTGTRSTAGNRDTRNVGARICQRIVDAHPNVVFLLEVVGQPSYVADSLQDCLARSALPGVWSAAYSHIGNVGSRTEYVVMLYGSDPATLPIELQRSEILDYTAEGARPGSWTDRLLTDRRRDGRTTVGEAGPENYLEGRVPFVATLKVGTGRYEIKLAAWHARSPDAVNDNSGTWASMAPYLRRSGVGAALGDFNYERAGTVPCQSGTTAAGRNYDRAVDLTVDGYAIGNQSCGELLDLSDHKPVFVNIASSNR